MSAKSSGAAIGGILLACLGFFRRGCDDVVRVADDIPFNSSADDYIIGADGRRVWNAAGDAHWGASDEIVSATRRSNRVPSHAELLAEKQELKRLLEMTAKRKQVVHGETFINDLQLIAKRSNGMVCFKEDGSITISFGMPAFGKALWVGTGVSTKLTTINENAKVEPFDSGCLFLQGVCCKLQNGRLVLDRMRTIECENGSLSVGAGAISFEAGDRSLALQLQVTAE